MLNFPKWKVLLIMLVCLASIVFSLPTLLGNISESKFLPSQKINLGLDLRGGSHLLLEVDFYQYFDEQLEILKDLIRKELRKDKIAIEGIKIIDKKIIFSLLEDYELKKIENSIRRVSSDVDINSQNNQIEIYYTSKSLNVLKDRLSSQSIEIIRRRVDNSGTKEPSIQKQGENYILLQLPGLNDPAHLKEILGQTAKLSFHLVNHDSYLNEGRIPSGSKLLHGEDHNGKKIQYLIYKKPILTGEMLTDAQGRFNETNMPVVSFNFNNIGAKIFADITRKNTGKALAIVLDNKVISAPYIDEPIIAGSGIIKGHFTVQSANNLALLLRAGALPAPIKIIEERTIGPSLGTDSIIAGKKAGLIGMIAVMVFMILTYRSFGFFANIALIFNMFFIVAILSCLQATLTLPGIAGIILTMGMAVDANVLIFERMREEAKNGLSAKATIERGFKNAFATIIDSNLTTIFAALLLYIFGAGAIRGFAITLIIGITSSMFSAITLTKYMIYLWLKIKKPKEIVI